MRVKFDPEADALYIRLSETDIDRTEEVSPGVILDFDIEARLVGIEVLNVERVMRASPRNMQFEIGEAAE
jgi:uncharacterized protein YuzE